MRRVPELQSPGTSRLYELTHWLVTSVISGAMPEQTGNELLPDFRQVMLVVFVEECVLLSPEQRLVNVHARSVDASNGLGHERGVDPLQLRQFLDHQTGGHYAVGHRQRVAVLEVNLVLAGRCLVVGILYGHIHLGQVEHRIPPEIAGWLAGKLVEIAAMIQGLPGSRNP